MASSSGTSSISTVSEVELQAAALMDERKWKRMLSNKESARRSRMRKQKHLDDVMAQVNQLKKGNHEMITSFIVHYIKKTSISYQPQPSKEDEDEDEGFSGFHQPQPSKEAWSIRRECRCVS